MCPPRRQDFKLQFCGLLLVITGCKVISSVCTQKSISGLIFTTQLHLVSQKTSYTLADWPGPQGLQRFQDPSFVTYSALWLAALLGQAWNPGSEAGQRPALLLLEPEDLPRFNFPDSQVETGYKNQNTCNYAGMNVLGHGEAVAPSILLWMLRDLKWQVPWSWRSWVIWSYL